MDRLETLKPSTIHDTPSQHGWKSLQYSNVNADATNDTVCYFYNGVPLFQCICHSFQTF